MQGCHDRACAKARTFLRSARSCFAPWGDFLLDPNDFVTSSFDSREDSRRSKIEQPAPARDYRLATKTSETRPLFHVPDFQARATCGFASLGVLLTARSRADLSLPG